MKPLFIAFVFIVTCAFGDATQNQAEVDGLVGRSPTMLVEQILKMPVEHRRELIAAIKRRSIPEYQMPDYALLLLHLGDAETIQKQADLMMQNDDQWALSNLQTCRDPQVIAVMCPLFVKGDMSSNFSYNASWAILSMIQHTPGFSTEMSKWAAEVREKDSVEVPMILREWWKINADAFKRKDYSSVKAAPFPLGDAPESVRKND